MNKSFENCTLLDTKTWFNKAVPEPKKKNFTTQLGVHYEEVCESLDELTANDEQTHNIIRRAQAALRDLSARLKGSEDSIQVPQGDKALLFLDALCDQIVTATGTGHMLGYDVVGAMTEVNRSNFSKFDAQGNPIFNENMKIMKGENYTQAVLDPYLPQ